MTHKPKPAEGNGGLGEASSKQTEPSQHTPPQESLQVAPQTAMADAYARALCSRASKPKDGRRRLKDGYWQMLLSDFGWFEKI
jgi:hypothetical protein